MQTGARVALAGMIVNVLLAAAKVTAGLLGNSYVLIADGIESVLDIGGSAVIWGGLKFAARPPDATHPYGHGKAEPLAAGIVAVGVLAAALGLAIQSVREIFLPHHAPAPFTLIVLVVVVVVKEFLYRSVIRLGKNVESTAVQTDAWHHRADAMTSIAAFIGISIALIGGDAGKARMPGPRSLPARSSRRTAIVCFFRPCTRCWTPRRAAKSWPLSRRRPRFREFWKSKNVLSGKWVFRFMSICMSAWMADFRARRA